MLLPVTTPVPVPRMRRRRAYITLTHYPPVAFSSPRISSALTLYICFRHLHLAVSTIAEAGGRYRATIWTSNSETNTVGASPQTGQARGGR